MKQIYDGKKVAKRTWPVGSGPTVKKIPKLFDEEQPFGPTEDEMREFMDRMREESDLEEEVGSNHPEEESEKNKSELEKESESEEESDSDSDSDSDDPDWTPREEYLLKRKKK
jgi:hypothetical protein